MKMLKVKIYSTPIDLGDIGKIADVKYISIDAKHGLWGDDKFPPFLVGKFYEALGDVQNVIRLNPSDPDLIRRNGIKLLVDDHVVFTQLDTRGGNIVLNAVEEYIKQRDKESSNGI